MRFGDAQAGKEEVLVYSWWWRVGWVRAKASYGIQVSQVQRSVVYHSLQARRDSQPAPALRKQSTPSLTQGSGPHHSLSACMVGTMVPSLLT